MTSTNEPEMKLDNNAKMSISLDSSEEEGRERKRACRNKSKVAPKESPMCVASMATLFLPHDLQLNSPKKDTNADTHAMPPLEAADSEAAEEHEPEHVGRHHVSSDRLVALFALQGLPLMHALQKERAEDFLLYYQGYLAPNVARSFTALYSHVLSQADVSESPVYGDTSPFNRNTELPKYYPVEDEETGLSRKHRLALALEADIWQWHTIAYEDFSLLDTIVWMGVHMQRFFEGE
eukprot:CAMPEP_0173081980 /NCGR_PEP_ID=MMETSP1102-20130122/17788_1 /TAXON_ID=49646 /ORGANISM="Geminigera sp., Strain Caron Lab Isolate" /LENGTH=235 /DNA_ID=CAMNT_0013957049 /DNA_START=127 /DNA_END=834 /DNA_ORIENTATION=+